MRLRGEVLGLDLTALLAPEAEQGSLIIAHDDPRVRATDEVAGGQQEKHPLHLSSIASIAVLSVTSVSRLQAFESCGVCTIVRHTLRQGKALPCQLAMWTVYQ